MKKNGLVSLLKFIFCLIIIIMHWGIPFEGGYLFEGGYIYVDFFFIVQGFYLIKDWKFNEDDTTWDFSIRYLRMRLKRFFPCVLYASIITFMFQLLLFPNSIKQLTGLVIEFVAQISFLSQLCDFMTLGIGGLLWFLSASIFCGTVVVYLCREFEKKVLIIMALLATICYNNIFNLYGNMNTWWNVILGGTIRTSLERAFGGIILGLVSRSFADYFNTIRFRRWVIYFGNIFVLLIALCSVCVAIYYPSSKADFYLIFLFAIMIILAHCLYDGKNNLLTDYLDSLCMPMYINQMFCIPFVSFFGERNLINCVFVIILDFCVSIIWIKVISKVEVKKLFIESVN